MKIGIFGGSFDPVHRGHIAVASAAVQQRLVDEVWLMVSPLNPLKAGRSMLPEELRLALAERALKGVHGVRASDFEFRLQRPNFTWRTLEALEAQHPQHTFSLIIGADNWAIFDRWVHAKRLREQHDIYVYPRAGHDIQPLPPSRLPLQSERAGGEAGGLGRYPTAVIDAPLYPFSSTDIRRAIADGASDDHLVTMLPQSIMAACRSLYSARCDE